MPTASCSMAAKLYSSQLEFLAMIGHARPSSVYASSYRERSTIPQRGGASSQLIQVLLPTLPVYSFHGPDPQQSVERMERHDIVFMTLCWSIRYWRGAL